MSETEPTLAQLRNLIGRRTRYRGNDCYVIEVIEDGPMLVLQDCATDTVIQADQHGEAHRRVAPVFNVAVWDRHSGGLNSAFVDLHLIEV